MTPTQKEFLAVLGYFYLQHERPARAAVLFAALDALEPHNAVVLKSLCCARLRAGQAQEALTIADRLLMGGEESPGLRIMRVQALAALGRHEEARQGASDLIRAEREALRPCPRP